MRAFALLVTVLGLACGRAPAPVEPAGPVATDPTRGSAEEPEPPPASSEPVSEPVAEPVAEPSGEPEVPADELAAAFDAGVTKLDETNYRVSRALVDRVFSNPMAFVKGARAILAVKDGKPVGIKLYGMRQGSPHTKLGLANGDTIAAINGTELTSMEGTLEVVSKLRDATTIAIALVRRGTPIKLTYTIR